MGFPCIPIVYSDLLLYDLARSGVPHAVLHAVLTVPGSGLFDLIHGLRGARARVDENSMR